MKKRTPVMTYQRMKLLRVRKILSAERGGVRVFHCEIVHRPVHVHIPAIRCFSFAWITLVAISPMPDVRLCRIRHIHPSHPPV